MFIYITEPGNAPDPARQVWININSIQQMRRVANPSAATGETIITLTNGSRLFALESVETLVDTL